MLKSIQRGFIPYRIDDRGRDHRHLGGHRHSWLTRTTRSARQVTGRPQLRPAPVKAEVAEYHAQNGAWPAAIVGRAAGTLGHAGRRGPER